MPEVSPDQGYEATSREELRRQITDCNVPKNEREWWAAHEIERLEAALATAQRERDVALDTIADKGVELRRVRAELAEARKQERELRDWRDRVMADPVMKALMGSLPPVKPLPDTGQP